MIVKSVAHLRRVIRQVQEQGDTLHTAILLEISCEETTCFQVDTHSTENDREVVCVSVVDALVDLGRPTD